jgi:hypothetical protein
VSFWSCVSSRFSSSAEMPAPFDFVRSSSCAWRRSVRISTRPSSIFVDLEPFDERRRGPPGAHGLGLVAERLDRLLHAGLGLGEDLFERHG